MPHWIICERRSCLARYRECDDPECTQGSDHKNGFDLCEDCETDDWDHRVAEADYRSLTGGYPPPRYIGGDG
jgi:hypothetical protein